MAEVLDRETIKALSTDTRQEIIKMLSKRPYTASEISKIMSKHVTTITEHLNTLEKSGLIRRKDNSNKWIYYALSDKGERLFKPKFYSWVVVIAISILCLFVGGAQIFSSSYGGAQLMAEKTDQAIAPAAPLANSERTINDLFGATSVQPAVPSYVVGIVLVIIAIAGFVYLFWRYRRNRNIVGTFGMIKL